MQDSKRTILDVPNAYLLGVSAIAMKGDKGTFLKYQVSIDGRTMALTKFDPTPDELAAAAAWVPAVQLGTLKVSLAPSGTFQQGVALYEGFVPNKA